MDTDLNKCSPVMLKINNTVSNMMSLLNSCLDNFKELTIDVNELSRVSQSNETELMTQIKRCNSNTCPSSEPLLEKLNHRDSLLESIKSLLKKFDETKEIKFINDLFNVLSLEKSSITPLKQKEMKDESLSEIENTPTGRTSPIIVSRNMKSSLVNGLDIKEKKKCLDSWPTPPKKNAKITNSTPNRRSSGRYVQSRLNLQKLKPSCTVDLTCSPELMNGSRLKKTDSCSDVKSQIVNPIDNPVKKKCLKLKRDSDENEKQIVDVKLEPCNNEIERVINMKPENNVNEDQDITDIENSINLMNHIPHRFKHPALIKGEKDPDYTTCSPNESMSLLNQHELEQKAHAKDPLTENINITNCELESSISLIRHAMPTKPSKPTKNNPIKMECDSTHAKEIDIPLYKEPTVRKKAEKRALPGWSCDECKNFYGKLHKDDPEMLAKLMQECSKHRGRHNPARPKTPEGFWNPRWDVPEDTAEFNLRNNAV